MSLAKKAVHSLAWIALSSFIIRILDFITKIILARLLLPSDFGLVAVGLLVVNTLGLFRNLGFGAALIYKKDDKGYKAANTAFILIPITGTILFVLAYLSSSFVATFFSNATVEPVVKVLAFTFVISSFGIVPSMLLEKELEFKKKVLPEALPRIGYVFVAITLALHGYGVWSLVFGQITLAILGVILIWMVSDWKPAFTFDKKAAKELFSYGKHILGASLIFFLVTNIDDAVVGKLLGISALGFYTVAYMISNLPATQITELVGRVMFPTYSKLQDDKEALRSAYLGTLKYVSLLSIPASFGIFVIAPDFVSIVLGDKWILAILPMQALCIYGLLRSIVATMYTIFTAVGNPSIIVKINSVQLLLTGILIYPLTKLYGILGTSFAIIIPLGIIIFWVFYKTGEIIGENISNIFKVFFPYLISSSIMAVFLYFIRDFIFFTISPILSLFIIIILGALFYVGMILLLEKDIILEIKELIKGDKL